jgi:glutamate formiminotransferase
MAQIVQCVPNFSEGWRPGVIEAIVNEMKQVPKVKVLDVLPDASHNRTVVTMVGSRKQ